MGSSSHSHGHRISFIFTVIPTDHDSIITNYNNKDSETAGLNAQSAGGYLLLLNTDESK